MIKNQSNTYQALWIGVSKLSTFAMGLVSAAILSRYFEKSEYGTYKQITYVCSMLSTVFAIGLPSAYTYFLPKLRMSQR